MINTAHTETTNSIRLSVNKILQIAYTHSSKFDLLHKLNPFFLTRPHFILKKFEAIILNFLYIHTFSNHSFGFLCLK